MICKNCNIQMKIERSGFKVEGDNAASEETKLYFVPIYRCVNSNCSQFGKEVRGDAEIVTLME